MKKDLQRLGQLLDARHPLIWIPGTQEHEAQQLVRELAQNRSLPIRLWTATEGLREGLAETGSSIPDTEHPAGALFYMRRHSQAGLSVMMDLTDHLDDARTLRLVRELIETQRSIRGETW